MNWLDEVVRDVAELPDRNSPDDRPAAMIVTAEELRGIIERRAGDPLYGAACWLCEASGKVSISHVQRVLIIGYNRAARLIERMETEGIVTHTDERGARQLVTPQKHKARHQG